MNYKNMKVAELRELVAERGLEPREGALKADLVEMLEADDGKPIEAEVVGAIERVSYTPAVIDAETYLAAKKSWLDQMLEPYEDMDDEAICAMNADEAKICRADVNRVINEVEGERKSIKRAYNEPLQRFEERVKELLEPARAASARLKQYIDDQEETQRDMRRQGLEATYNDFAPALVPVVPFERILEINPRWLNKSYGAGKAAQELEDAVAKIAEDWEALKKQASLMRFYDESEAVFFRTLDLGKAMEHNAMREDEAQRIAAMKDEVQANIEQAERHDEEERVRYVIEANLTQSEKRELISFMQQNRIGTDRIIRAFAGE